MTTNEAIAVMRAGIMQVSVALDCLDLATERGQRAMWYKQAQEGLERMQAADVVLRRDLGMERQP